ncbi:MAG: helix-turn-helix domain-containing protein [Acidimicrobiales bacterium]
MPDYQEHPGLPDAPPNGIGILASRKADTIPHLLLTPEAAAGALSIGRSRVYELMASGELRSIRIGRSRRIPVAALEELIDSLAAGS